MRSTVWTTLKLCLGLAIVLAIYRRLALDPGSEWPGWGQVRWSALVLCAVLMPVNLLLETQVWRLLLAGAGASISFGRAIPAVLAGFSSGAVSPGGVGDFVGRVVRVPSGKRWVTGFAMLLSRLGDVIPLTFFGVIATLWLLPRSIDATQAWMTAVVFTSVPIGLAAAAIYSGSTRGRVPARLTRRLESRWPNPARAITMTTSIAGPVRRRALALATARYATFVAQLVLAVIAVGATPSNIPELFGAASAVFLLRGVAPPVTLMGLGIREAAAVAVLALVGISGQFALVASLVVFALNIVLPAIVGIPFLLFPRWRPGLVQS